MGLIRWLAAAALLAGLILGVGCVFAYFLADDVDWQTLVVGLLLTGFSGAGLLHIQPGESTVEAGRQHAFGVLVIYAIAASAALVLRVDWWVGILLALAVVIFVGAWLEQRDKI